MCFKLDRRLEQDSYLVIDSFDYQLRLHKSNLVPWYILVPKTKFIELFDCDKDFTIRILQAVELYSKKLREKTGSDKINIATIGNVVEQCHIHIIARFVDDFAWPSPVWGKSELNESLYSDDKQLDYFLKLFD